MASRPQGYGLAVASFGAKSHLGPKLSWLPCTAGDIVQEAPRFRLANPTASCLGQLRDKELNRRHGSGLITTILVRKSWKIYMELDVVQ